MSATPRPWNAESSAIYGPDGLLILYVMGKDFRPIDEILANIELVLLAVNEHDGLRAERDKLRIQRDELLAAAKSARLCMKMAIGAEPEWRGPVDALTEVIAKCEKEG